jgi:hypothetical protein
MTLTSSERRYALALLDLRTEEWMARYGDYFPDLRDLLAQVQDCIDAERTPE